MKVRVLYRPDGGISVVHPAKKSRKPGESENAWLTRVFDAVTPDGMEYEDMDSSELPDSREYRGIWEGQKGVGISIDSSKAEKIDREKKIKKEEINILREQAIKSLKDKGEIE